MKKDKNFNYDCRFFVGEKPCIYKRVCPGCPHYAPFKERILIIKIGALGDVLRTTPLLHPLKKRYPESQVTWLTDKEAVPLLAMNRFIDRVISFGAESALQLQAERFDIIINFEKTPWAAALAVILKGKKKIGFGLEECGAIYPINKEAVYAFRLGVDDDLKFRKNKKSYQEIIFEAAGFKYRGEEYVLEAGKPDRDFLKRKRLDNLKRPVIGLNTGSGSIFAGKGWTKEGWLGLMKRIESGFNSTCLLLGGKREEELNGYLVKMSKSSNLIDTGSDNSLKEFMAIVDMCDLVVAGDTLGMHIAIGLKKKVVALFGSTCPQEIDLYGRGVKLVAPELSCSPCYRGVCDKGEACLKNITVEMIMSSIKTLLR